MSLSLAQRRVMIAMNDMELDNELSPCLLDQLWGGSRFSPDMDPTDAWELLKTYGLVDDEMGKIIDWQMYHEDRTFPVVAAKEEWMPLEPWDRLSRVSASYSLAKSSSRNERLTGSSGINSLHAFSIEAMVVCKSAG